MAAVTDDDELPLASVRAAYNGEHCRRCRKAVIWLTTANGRALAVDAVPAADGRVELIRSVGTVVAVQHGTAPPDGHSRYRVHVAGCTPRTRGWRGRAAPS